MNNFEKHPKQFDNPTKSNMLAELHESEDSHTMKDPPQLKEPQMNFLQVKKPT